MDETVAARMRADWNRRAREDAHYFAAFGRRNQDDEEFFATAAEQVRGLERELRRLPPAPPAARRALEIGCGPGRLMRPLSRHFGQIHGLDVSDEMVRLARLKLAAIPHAYLHHAPHSDLRAFAADSFDFVYSYAVFQHIPSGDVVFGYLREAARVLKPGGILRCQMNGLPEAATRYDTWSGVRIPAARLKEFARGQQLQLLALEGVATQYMWVTMRKPGALPAESRARQTSIRRATNAHSSEPVVPARGRFAAISLWVEGLPAESDLNSMHLLVGARPGALTYLGPPEHDGLQQVNALLPEGLGTGLHLVELGDHGRRLCAPVRVRLIPPGPPVPRLISLTDGIDLLSGTRIVTRTIKLTLEEVEDPTQVWIRLDNMEVQEKEDFCTDPRVPRHEVNFRLPEGAPAGRLQVQVGVGKRGLGMVEVEVVG